MCSQICKKNSTHFIMKLYSTSYFIKVLHVHEYVSQSPTLKAPNDTRLVIETVKNT